MLRSVRPCLFAAAALSLHAADNPSWKDKPIPQWDEQDAKLVLADSPWVKCVKLGKVRDLSKFERRDGGNMEDGIGPTVDFGATGFLGPLSEAIALERARQRPQDWGSVTVRWVSALPIRAAESKTRSAVLPMWQGDYFAVAVYNILAPRRWNLANELKGVASLQGEMKKDLKPARVLIARQDDGLATIVYLFSRFAMAENATNLRFVAQIGRWWVAQYFFPAEMQFEGKPEL